MAKILLDYVFPISVITPLPAASTAFLKQVCVVVKPKAGQEANVGDFFTCVNMTEVAARTDNAECQQLFNAGMNKVILLLADDLDIEAYLDENAGEFFTLLISSDFDDRDLEEHDAIPAVKAAIAVQEIDYEAAVAGVAGNDITIKYVTGGTAGSESVSVVGNAIEVQIENGVSTATQVAAAIAGSGPASALVNAAVQSGQGAVTQDIFTDPIALEDGADLVPASTGLLVGSFDGVKGASSSDDELCGRLAILPNFSAFFTNDTNKAKNLFFAFGKLLSNLSNWSNQQFITMPFNDGIDELGQAESLFDDRISFVLNDSEFGNVLGFFAAGGKAIVAPYILKNFRVDTQSNGLQWIAANQPQYTLSEAALLQNSLNEKVSQPYIDRKWVESASIEILLQEQNFVANSNILVSEPKALWRVFGEMRQTV